MRWQTLCRHLSFEVAIRDRSTIDGLDNMLSDIQQIESVLFVCLGNICRSPMAEGVFRAHAQQHGLAGKLEIASAGTGGWHVGAAPDERAIAAAHARGIDISQQQARQVKADDFEIFDLICAMDEENLSELEGRALRNRGGRANLCLLLDFAPELNGGNVPDPYYGGVDGFETVLAMIEQASLGLIDQLISAKG